MTIVAITLMAVALSLIAGLGVGLTCWWVALLALAWRELRRPGERFRDFVPRMSFPGDFYERFRGADRP